MTTSPARREAKKPPPRPYAAQPWEQQPWEKDSAYEAFFYYYLMQEERPRVKTAAYRSYATAKGKAIRIDKQGRTNIPNYFSAWMYGVNSANERPAGTVWENALTWDERVREYDKHLAAEAEEMWRARQLALRQKEWDSGQALLARAETMMMDFDPSRTEWTDDTIARHLKAAFELMRRAAGMPDKVEVINDWRKEIRLIGMNPDDVIETFAALITGSDSGDEPEKPDA